MQVRLILFLVAVVLGAKTAFSSEDEPRMAKLIFCDYVADFAPQIARNRIREVPFLRMNEFEYFDVPRSEFLQLTAEQIYAIHPEELRSALGSLATTYHKECLDAFGPN